MDDGGLASRALHLYGLVGGDGRVCQTAGAEASAARGSVDKREEQGVCVCV